MDSAEQKKPKRGFAALSPERQKELARQGGKAAHQQGKAHKWTTERKRKKRERKAGRQPRKNGQRKTTTTWPKDNDRLHFPLINASVKIKGRHLTNLCDY